MGQSNFFDFKAIDNLISKFRKMLNLNFLILRLYKIKQLNKKHGKFEFFDFCSGKVNFEFSEREIFKFFLILKFEKMSNLKCSILNLKLKKCDILIL